MNRIRDQAIIVKEGLINKILPVDELPAGQHEILHCIYFDPDLLTCRYMAQRVNCFRLIPFPIAFTKCMSIAGQVGRSSSCLLSATNTVTVFHQCIDAVRKYQDANGQGVIGLHIEGPWINPLKRGAHISDLIHSPAMEEVKALINYGKGIIKMITLAPEVCSPEIIAFISSENIIVSAGHSNATYQQGIDAFNSGIPAATHLFNAMSSFHHREPGLPGAVMQHNKVMASIIPDGYHVNFEAISIAKKNYERTPVHYYRCSNGNIHRCLSTYF